MAGPSRQEHMTASGAAYTITQSGGFVVPSGWSVLKTSNAAQRSGAFAAVAFKDPSGNIIIVNEGTNLSCIPPYVWSDVRILGTAAPCSAGAHRPAAVVSLPGADILPSASSKQGLPGLGALP